MIKVLIFNDTQPKSQEPDAFIELYLVKGMYEWQTKCGKQNYSLKNKKS